MIVLPCNDLYVDYFYTEYLTKLVTSLPFAGVSLLSQCFSGDLFVIVLVRTPSFNTFICYRRSKFPPLGPVYCVAGGYAKLASG